MIWTNKKWQKQMAQAGAWVDTIKMEAVKKTKS
jgi:hypothetical protein